MNKEKAMEFVSECEKDCNHHSGRVISALGFVEWLYDKHGGVIANKEEHDKINGMTSLAEAHGMNPFKPKE